MFVFFIGMPGSGKTTEGAKFAELLDVPFMDLDHLIEKSENKSITKIFEEKGEDYFRKLERRKLESLSYLEDTLVVSTGGGTPCFFDNLSLMKEMGYLIFLDPPMDVIQQRVGLQKNRPLLAGDLTGNLNKLYNQRKSFYNQADYTFREATPDLQKLKHHLRNKL